MAELGDVALVALAAELLTDADPDLARAAEVSLLGMVVRARNRLWSEAERDAWQKASDDPHWAGALRSCDDAWGPREESQLAGSLAQGLQAFDAHRRRGVLLATLLFCDRTLVRGARNGVHAGLTEAVTSREHVAHGPLMSLLRARAVPTGRLRALEWLAVPAACRAASARLGRADGPLDHELVLASAHLCLRPARRRALAAIRAAGRAARRNADAPAEAQPTVRVELPMAGPLPVGGVIPLLSSPARRLVPLWASVIGATGPERHSANERLLADEDLVVRMACVLHSVSSLRIDQVLDPDQRVSRSAYLAWGDDAHARRDIGGGRDEAAQRGERSRLLALFSRLPHPRVRALAAIDRAFDPDCFSPALPAPSVAGTAHAYRRLAEDRAAFLEDLSVRLGDASNIGGGWSRVMHLARRLGVAAEIEHLLREVAAQEPANTDIARNIAQAVTLLGDVATPSARAALQRALTHADARVRANAVESLSKHDRLARVPSPLIIELKADGHHRVRANAVRAALVTDLASPPLREQALFERKPDGLNAGVDSLASMLSDDRVTHRLAGAWLAWKVLPAGGPLRLHSRWPEMVARVAEVAQFDAEPKVRARAARCAQLVEASLSAATMHGPGSLMLGDGV